jgi:hypothetical protein
VREYIKGVVLLCSIAALVACGAVSDGTPPIDASDVDGGSNDIDAGGGNIDAGGGNIDAACADADSDTVCDAVDVCAGSDDLLDADADGVPDGCDICAGFDDNIDTNMNSVPDGCEACPPGGANILAGPDIQYGYCFYLGVAGATCDQACNFAGGSNMAVAVQNLWADSCAAPAISAADVSTWYFENGNPGNWLAPATGPLAYHTLGYGYSGAFGDIYYGKCSTGANLNAGTYPGETSDKVTRQLVCACADPTP